MAHAGPLHHVTPNAVGAGLLSRQTSGAASNRRTFSGLPGYTIPNQFVRPHAAPTLQPAAHTTGTIRGPPSPPNRSLGACCAPAGAAPCLVACVHDPPAPVPGTVNDDASLLAELGRLLGGSGSRAARTYNLQQAVDYLRGFEDEPPKRPAEMGELCPAGLVIREAAVECWKQSFTPIDKLEFLLVGEKYMHLTGRSNIANLPLIRVAPPGSSPPFWAQNILHEVFGHDRVLTQRFAKHTSPVELEILGEISTFDYERWTNAIAGGDAMAPQPAANVEASPLVGAAQPGAAQPGAAQPGAQSVVQPGVAQPATHGAAHPAAESAAQYLTANLFALSQRSRLLSSPC